MIVGFLKFSEYRVLCLVLFSVVLVPNILEKLSLSGKQALAHNNDLKHKKTLEHAQF